MIDIFYNTKHVAKLLGCSEAMVRNLCNKGSLPHFRTPKGHIRFVKREFDELLATMTSSQMTSIYGKEAE